MADKNSNGGSSGNIKAIALGVIILIVCAIKAFSGGGFITSDDDSSSKSSASSAVVTTAKKQDKKSSSVRETETSAVTTTTAKQTTAPETTTTAATTASEQNKEYTEYYFRTKKLRDSHYEKHGIEMGFDSADDYRKAASDVINDPDALSKTEKEDGDTCYYIEATDEFVVLSTDGYIRTYFNPGGKAYFDRQ